MGEHGTYTGSGMPGRPSPRPNTYPDGDLTGDGLLGKLRTAYNIEARAGHGAEHLALWRIGIVDYGHRLKVVYEDGDGNNWYDTLFREPDGRVVTETEHILGRGVAREVPPREGKKIARVGTRAGSWQMPDKRTAYSIAQPAPEVKGNKKGDINI